jgi:hypothetical protein
MSIEEGENEFPPDRATHICMACHEWAQVIGAYEEHGFPEVYCDCGDEMQPVEDYKSEDDECETCEDKGYVVTEEPVLHEPCPDCTDDSEEYEPAPEDEELENYKDFRPSLERLRRKTGYGMIGYIQILEASLDQLESEFEDVKEERDELKTIVIDINNKFNRVLGQ